jgi:hypothetical protein
VTESVSERERERERERESERERECMCYLAFKGEETDTYYNIDEAWMLW